MEVAWVTLLVNLTLLTTVAVLKLVMKRRDRLCVLHLESDLFASQEQSESGVTTLV